MIDGLHHFYTNLLIVVIGLCICSKLELAHLNFERIVCNMTVKVYSNNAEYTNRWNFWKYISKSMLNTKKCAEIVLKDNNSAK